MRRKGQYEQNRFYETVGEPASEYFPGGAGGGAAVL